MKSEIGEPIRVSSYSGYKGEERPERFEYKGKTFRVLEITDRWMEGTSIAGDGIKSYFRVKGDDKRSYLLFFDPNLKEWFLDQRSSGQSGDES